MNSSEPEAATECQDLMGMSFPYLPLRRVWSGSRGMSSGFCSATCVRLTHSMRMCSSCCSGTARPNLWHLRTPVHMFRAPDGLRRGPIRNAKFLWSHRDPAKVLGSVCSLIAYNPQLE